jgi:phytoene dehydrogenase-like protein
MSDIIVIGGGLNGLVAATWLARQKFSVVLLDRHDTVGGAAITTTTAAGYRVPTLSHSLGPISSDVVRALKLEKAGIEFLTPDPALTTFGREGEVITFHRDPVLTAASIGAHAPTDAAQWQPFLKATQRMAGVLSRLNRQPPPSIDAPDSGDLWRLLQVGHHARGLGGRELARLTRYIPMPVADLVAEWFSHDLVQAAIAAHAVFGHHAGPWSAGTGALLLQRVADDPMPVGGGVTARGGPGAVTTALAQVAQQAGVSIRTNARVIRVLTRDGHAHGVALESGEELHAHAVVAAVAPKHVLQDLCDPADLPPTYARRVRQIRARGVTSTMTLSLDGLPSIPSLHGDEVPLRGRMLFAPSVDMVERAFDAAKYGQVSAEPWIELCFPSVADPSLAPGGHHVASLYVQYTPRDLRESSWATERETLFGTVMNTLSAYVPDLESRIVEREIVTPEDLETRWGLPGGQITHGEQALDQWWVSRPLLGFAPYGTPVGGLYLASGGTHPGGGLTGQSGLNAARIISMALRRRR